MHVEAFQRCESSCSTLQGVHRRAASLVVRNATQKHAPLQIGRADGSFVQKVRVRSGFVGNISQGVSASSSRRSSKRSVADQTLPVTPEVVLLATPILIVAIPWALGHLQLCLAVGAVIALSPFGTVIWTLVPPSLGRPFKQQQQRWRHRSSRVSWPSTERAQPFWPVESQLLQRPSLVVEADVLGPLDEVPQRKGNSPYRASAMPQRPVRFQQSSVRPATHSISRVHDMPQREVVRRHRRVRLERGVGQAGVHDGAVATVSATVPADRTTRQAALDFVAPLQPTGAGFWEDKPLGKGRRKSHLSRTLRRVPFVGSWGGLL